MYISIASYRDPLLQSTINSAFENADNPEELRVGCFISILSNDKNMDEHLVFNNYDGRVRVEVQEAGNFFSVTRDRNKALSWLVPEDKYVLQIDSHTRFLKGWDSQLIKCYEEVNDKKALLSCYVPKWDIGLDGCEVYQNTERNLDFYSDLDYNIKSSKDNFFKNYEIVPSIYLKENKLKNTIKTWHLCGHFIFSTVDYFLSIKQPEWICFWGEELYNSLIAFTNGYNVYYPNVMPLRSIYPQDLSDNFIQNYLNGKKPNKVWIDFKGTWHEHNKASTDRIIDSLLEEQNNKFFGSVRSLDQLYEFRGYNLSKLLESWRDEYRKIY